MLEVSHITKIYNPGEVTELCLFHDFSLTVKDGSFVSVVGSNGSGKTSLLNLICGSMRPDAGEILLDGTNIIGIPEYKNYAVMGRVYQNPAVGNSSALTVFENLSLSDNKHRPFGLSFALDRKKREEYRALLAPLGMGLEDKLDVKVGLLSGGQRQALSLLMATMTPIRFLILDEHTAALDPKTAETIMALTDRIVREKGLTAIMVTHNLRYAVEYGDRLIMMHRGEIVLDRDGEDKKKTEIADILKIFNDISIECGN